MTIQSEKSPLFKGLDNSELKTVETLDESKAEKFVFDTVDYNDPDRPNTCLEVDFPILKVNEISAIENNATKPIYMMSKWWARRRSSVFRQLLISAATKSPKNKTLAAQTSWSLMYRKNHQRHGKYKPLKVVDLFMGGGTTVVEAARMGFQITGIDINPIAWWVVKNETDPAPVDEIEQFYEYIEKTVKPQIMPFYTAQSPRKNEASWYIKSTNSETSENLLQVGPDERKCFEWRGPEVIYTFWMKHIMCSDPACCHLTPQLRSSVVAEKALSIKCWHECVCPKCGEIFDLEDGEFRMAPSHPIHIAEDATPFAAINKVSKIATCPHCKSQLGEKEIESIIDKKGKPRSKKTKHYLVLPKKWLTGIAGQNKTTYGGTPCSNADQNSRWYKDRAIGLELIEVRGNVPEYLEHSNYGPKKQLICGGCGILQDPLKSIMATKKLAPMFPYLIQGFDPQDKKDKQPYNGRFFDLPDFETILSAFHESREHIYEYIPSEPLWFGHHTHQRDNLPAHGYSHWHQMFNARQLHVLGLILKTIDQADTTIASTKVKSQVLGGFQNYLRHNCMFTIWDRSFDKIAPHFSNNNYYPKATPVENSVFSDLGRGNFKSCIKNVMKGNRFAKNTYDLIATKKNSGKKSEKYESNDKIITSNVTLKYGSSTSIKEIEDGSVDLIITDPPFGDNVNYAEFADFFLVWLLKPLSKIYPKIFGSSESPKTLEAVSNRARHPGSNKDGTKKCDAMYDRLMTMAWKEAARILRPGGLMAFTFHHDKDTAWINVLESLFKGGFYIQSTFPIRSDATKGSGEFGSKKIEFDIVHVCRKRIEEPKSIYWATLRRNIERSVKSHSSILAQHRHSGLHLADIEVIIRGEVLEQYSKHYGRVKKNLAGDLMSIREILLEANSIAVSLLQQNDALRVPEEISAEGKIFYTLFRDSKSIEHSDAKKRLKGAGISLEEFESNGWLEVKRVEGTRLAKAVSPLDRWHSLSRKRTLKTDIDQAHFIVSSCIPGRQLGGKAVDLEGWIVENYRNILPSTRAVLQFLSSSHFGSNLEGAIAPAIRTFDRTIENLRTNDGEFKAAMIQPSLFGD